MPPKKTVRARSSSPAPTAAAKAKVSRAEAKKDVPAAAVLASKVDPEVPLDPATGIVYHLGCAAKDIAQRFIFVGDPGRVPVVAERFDKNSITFQGSHREIAVITGKYKGTPVTVLSTGMGTDNCEIVLNEIHALQEYNVKTGEWAKKPAPVKIIRVGTCGSPRGEVEVGTLAITQHAIGMDNTCRYYTAPASIHPASVRTLEGIVNKTAFSKVGGVYCSKAAEGITKALTDSFNSNAAVKKRRGSIVGTTASGSGFYGCQGRAVGRFRQHLAIPNLVDLLGSLELPLGTGKGAAVEKVVNIEMENSCICFLSRMLGYEAGTVCAIIAARAGDKRAFATPDQAKSAIADAITVALDALIAA